VSRRCASGLTLATVPVFGCKNNVSINRGHGFLRRYIVTHAAAHDGGQRRRA
jgi:hypothetical protein